MQENAPGSPVARETLTRVYDQGSSKPEMQEEWLDTEIVLIF